MTRYRKLPVEIEAVRFNGLLHGRRPDFAEVPGPGWLITALAQGDDPQWKECPPVGALAVVSEALLVVTLEGVMLVSPGDFIIRGVKGELYACKPDIFAETYEAVD